MAKKILTSLSQRIFGDYFSEPRTNRQGEPTKSVTLPIIAGESALIADPKSEWAQALLLHFQGVLKQYFSTSQRHKILRAYHFAFQKHAHQKRSSGSFYITHPISVAIHCARWRLDHETLCAALLHDVVEDQGVSLEEIERDYGKKIAELVDGVSKLDRIQFHSKIDADAENLRKMLLAMSNDLRVILIKLADRLHNIQTIGSLSTEKKKRIARETLEIYVPIAHRLGLRFVYPEMQDLAFRAYYPLRYHVLQKSVASIRQGRVEFISQLHEAISGQLAKHKIQARLAEREKTLFSIYRKMSLKKLHFDEINDIYGVRVIVKTVSQCYQALGLLHALYKPVPQMFQDFIAIPKNNGYQSLHSLLVGPSGINFECQIRTEAMDRVCESGIAAHWQYKTAGTQLNQFEKNTINWLRSTVITQVEGESSAEFLEQLKLELFPDAVYVFTPKGKIISLPRNATALDFAYTIHTDIGLHAISCRINGIPMKLPTELTNGDRIEIQTAEHAHPTPSQLRQVHTARARAAIRTYLRENALDQTKLLGYQLLGRALLAQGLSPQPTSDLIQQLLTLSHQSELPQLYQVIGMNKLNAHALVALLEQKGTDQEVTPTTPPAPFTIDQESLKLMQFSDCCSPLPGDTIVGLYRPMHGIEVHMTNCPRYLQHKQRQQRNNEWLELAWQNDLTLDFSCRIQITAENQLGLLASIANATSQLGINISGAQMNDRANSRDTIMALVLQLRDRKHLAQLIRALRRIPGVIKAQRSQLQTDVASN